MRFLFNLFFWTIILIVAALLLFYVTKFAIIVISTIVGIGITSGILLYIFRNRK